MRAELYFRQDPTRCYAMAEQLDGDLVTPDVLTLQTAIAQPTGDSLAGKATSRRGTT
jgi:hypothetical protein